MLVYRGSPLLQRGRGLFSFLSKIGSRVLPWIGSIGREIFSSPLTMQVGRTVADSVINKGLSLLNGTQEQPPTIKTKNPKEVLAAAKREVDGVLHQEVKRRKRGSAAEGVLASIAKLQRPRHKRTKIKRKSVFDYDSSNGE